MQSIRNTLQLVVLLIMVATTASCDAIMKSEDERLKGSGVVEVVEVVLALETGGQIAQVLVDEGDKVNTGDILVRFDAIIHYNKDVTRSKPAQNITRGFLVKTLNITALYLKS